jgi:hypothetical protein
MRKHDWWESLTQYIEDNRHRALVWGEWDCCQFASGCVLTMTGTDHRASFPTYANEDEALAIIAGFGSVELLLTSVLGESKPVAHAKRGDIVAIDAGAGVAAGVCLGVTCAVIGLRELQFLPCAQATAAWTIE